MPKHAIASLYCGEDRGYLRGLIALGRSIMNLPYEQVLLVEKNAMSDWHKHIMQQFGWQVREVPRIDSPRCNYNAARWVHTFTKLNVFGLSEFDRVLFLDADCIVTGDISSLFTRKVKGLGACWVNRTAGRFNSGVMVIEPEKFSLQEMVEALTNLPPKQTGVHTGDQGFLNFWIRNWTQLPDRFNQRHWLRPTPNVAIAHLRPHPWRRKKRQVHAVPYYRQWDKLVQYAAGRSLEITNKLRMQTAHGVEVGAFNGRNAEAILQFCPNVRLDVVDVWSSNHYRKVGADRLERFYGWAEMESECRNRLRQFQDRCEIHKEQSTDAAKKYKDASLDFVFIDAEHTYEALSKDIRAWLPKIKPGGWIGGHDYAPRWRGVIKAVDQAFPKVRKGKDATWFADTPPS